MLHHTSIPWSPDRMRRLIFWVVRSSGKAAPMCLGRASDACVLGALGVLASTEPTAHKYVRSASNGETTTGGEQPGETRDEEVHPHRSSRSGARYSGLGFCPAIPQ